MSGWYELDYGKDGEHFHFVLKAGNGEVILSSQMYTTKSAALNGIHSVQENSQEDEQFERKEASNGKFYFNLKAKNHQIIGTSQMYVAEAGRDKGIASVQNNGSSEKIKDLSLEDDDDE